MENEDFYSSDRIVVYPADKPPPDLVMELTSPATRMMDLECKVKLYARCRVANYVVIDREEGHIVVYGIFNSTDQEYTKCEKYEKDQIVGAFPFEEMTLTAEDLLNPKISTEEALDSPVKRGQSVPTRRQLVPTRRQLRD